ncbi:Uncharacterized protein APZ42_026962 [Daphnia magna]|uniref:Uncharacterized protein n=1 Tax=Daphnia magna TaxID=35525 RepID=A0A164RTS3_9CRUS|nr:Uncharacterized protein APZ42_026962 [Daphnia magna]
MEPKLTRMNPASPESLTKDSSSSDLNSDPVFPRRKSNFLFQTFRPPGDRRWT